MKVIDSLSDNTLRGKKAAFALGFFDGLHKGHIAVINSSVNYAKAHGLTPCVFTFKIDRDVFKYKTGGKLITAGIFADVLAGLGVQYIIKPDFNEFKDLSGEEFVRALKNGFGVQFISCGENFAFGKDAACKTEEMQGIALKNNVELNIEPIVRLGDTQISSTGIRKLITAGEVRTAARMIGRNFAIDFEVVHGKKLGRKLGSPTINQPFPKDFIIPKFGVYASITHIGGERHVSVTNVGIKPTVGSDTILAETYIHDFCGDLYGRNTVVEFVDFMRPEKKFDSLEQLKNQIYNDSEAAKTIVSRN